MIDKMVEVDRHEPNNHLNNVNGFAAISRRYEQSRADIQFPLGTVVGIPEAG
jgi:hypothetical protein